MEIRVKYPQPYIKYLFVTGFIGLLASIFVGIGEFLVHYSSGGYQSDVSFGFFKFVSDYRLQLGHYLMIIGLPFYLFGYLHIYLALRPGNKKLASLVLFLGVCAFMIGGVWVGSRGFMGSIFHILEARNDLELYNQIADQYNFYLENLVQLLRILVLLISGLFVFAILKYETLYSRWMAMFNPFGLLVLIFLTFLFVPMIGNFLIPTAMNVAHFVLFSASLISLTLKRKIHQ